MATREELIDGVNFLIRESARIQDRLDDAAWAQPRHSDGEGWTSKDVYGHTAALATLVVPFVGNLANAEPGVDSFAGLDVNALNAANAAARASKTPRELQAEFDAGYNALIEWLKTAPADLLEKRATAGGYKDMTISDLMMQMVIMHGCQHLYEAASWVP